MNIIPTDIVAVTISGNKLTISGIKAGNATVTVTGSDGGKANLTISVTKKTDPDAAFKADATLRWETVGEATIDINNTSYTFVADRGTLFSSTQNKWGHASLDGQRFRLIEWGTSPQMRTENGIVTVTSFQSVKEEGKIVWMKFSANGVIHRVVAEKLS
ncbi:MAG: hypothetical protein LBP63_11290 [Prevotellaceae bacterium]|nr:hypothetical protein [Prevotellaceae bacterium]